MQLGLLLLPLASCQISLDGTGGELLSVIEAVWILKSLARMSIEMLD